MNIKIPEYLLKMPQYLPNDIEGMIFTYPNKFPKIIENYEDAANKYAMDPEGFRKYGDSQKKELVEGLNKIKKEYEECKNKDLKFLVEIDEKLNKLFCFRFWIVNYLFADGPIHSFYVDNLKMLIRKFVKAEETEKYESKVEEITQILLQSDYADEYLEQALKCNLVLEELNKIKEIQDNLNSVINLIDDDPMKNMDDINNIWKEIWDYIEKSNNEKLFDLLHIALVQVKFRSSMLPLYNTLTHTIEFRKENMKLKEKNDNMKLKINDIFIDAKSQLDKDEFDLLKMSYEQARNFAMYKDVMGAIDGKLLPFWFGIHDEIKVILKQLDPNMPIRSGGQAAMFYYLVWYLPDDLKAIVMKPDFSDFSLDNI